MGQKAKNGGALGRAKFSHLSVRDTIDGREIRTVATDPERAPRLCSWL
jgi:site-specific DNA recombinase